jgi:hypothetical protein|tara:strand:+ start:1106 stop:1210 length:105 start_codon:yes stop_codon:yes gene_type:complete
MSKNFGHTKDEWGSKKKKKLVIEAYDVLENIDKE